MAGPSSPVRPKDRAKVSRVYINLGRTGDAIASLPLCYLYWRETGKKAALMVHRQFASFLDGVSYVEPQLWDGDWKDVGSAREHCRRLGYKEIKVAQIYGTGITVGRATSSFILESWHQVGRLADWAKAPLVFDRRNAAREAKLAEKLPTGLPIILVAADGVSSPFEHRDEMIQTLRFEFTGKAHIVNLEDYRSDYFHDFLGLMDRSACLVTIDTGFGQLACASPVPVVALIAYKPTTWHSSPRRAQHRAYIRYNEFRSRKAEFVQAVRQCIEAPARKQTNSARIHHVWSGVALSHEAIRRVGVAQETWKREAYSYGNWKEYHVGGENFKRSARDIGDPVDLPYISDMLDHAAANADDDDILLITNSDISFVPGLAQELVDKCHAVGATYCHRWDFPRVKTHIERKDIHIGSSWYIGCDLFACSKKWWSTHKHKLPPLVLGRECWDWVFRVLIEETGGSQIEKGIYHEKHSSPWEVTRNLKGNVYNRSYCRAFLQERGLPLKEIENEPHVPVAWPPS